MPTSFTKHLSRFLLGGRSKHSSKKQKQKQKQTKQDQMRIIGTKEEDETHESVVAEENDGKDEKEEQEQQEHDSPRSKTTKTSNFHDVEEVEEEEATENDDQKIGRMMIKQLQLQQQQQHLQQQIQELDQQIRMKKQKQQQQQKKKQQQKVVLEPSVLTSEAVETTVTASSLLSQSPTTKELHTSIMTLTNTMQPSSNLASPCQDDHDNDFGFDGDAFSIRSIISGLTELTHDNADATKRRRRRERERRVLTGSSSTTSIPKTIAFSTLSGRRSSNKFEAPLSPSTTMTTMLTIDEDDTNANNNSMSRDKIQTGSSTTTGRPRQEEISSLLLERLLRKETKNSSLSTQRFDLSFQNNNTATQFFPL